MAQSMSEAMKLKRALMDATQGGGGGLEDDARPHLSVEWTEARVVEWLRAFARRVEVGAVEGVSGFGLIVLPQKSVRPSSVSADGRGLNALFVHPALSFATFCGRVDWLMFVSAPMDGWSDRWWGKDANGMDGQTTLFVERTLLPMLRVGAPMLHVLFSAGRRPVVATVETQRLPSPPGGGPRSALRPGVRFRDCGACTRMVQVLRACRCSMCTPTTLRSKAPGALKLDAATVNDGGRVSPPGRMMPLKDAATTTMEWLREALMGGGPNDINWRGYLPWLPQGVLTCKPTDAALSEDESGFSDYLRAQEAEMRHAYMLPRDVVTTNATCNAIAACEAEGDRVRILHALGAPADARIEDVLATIAGLKTRAATAPQWAKDDETHRRHLFIALGVEDDAPVRRAAEAARALRSQRDVLERERDATRRLHDTACEQRYAEARRANRAEAMYAGLKNGLRCHLSLGVLLRDYIEQLRTQLADAGVTPAPYPVPPPPEPAPGGCRTERYSGAVGLLAFVLGLPHDASEGAVLKAAFDAIESAHLLRKRVAELEPEPAPAPRKPSRPSVWFKMPGDVDHADRRTFAACDDPCRTLNADDDDCEDA